MAIGASAASFCNVRVFLDKANAYDYPKLSSPMILKDYSVNLDQINRGIQMKLTLEHQISQKKKVLIWILAPDFRTLNVSLLCSSCEQKSFNFLQNYVSFILNDTIFTDEIVLNFRNMSDLYRNINRNMAGRTDMIFPNAKVFLLDPYSNHLPPPNSDSGNSFDYKLILYILLGIVLFVVAAVFIKKYYDLKKMDRKPSLRDSGASSIYIEDDAYTIHSQSTISTLPSSNTSINSSLMDRSRNLARQIKAEYD
jgi:hypothetical protein